MSTPQEQVSEQSDAQQKLELLLNISQALGEEFQLDRMLITMVSEVTRAMRAERTSLFLYDEPAKQLYTKVAEGMNAVEIRVPLGIGIVGMTAEARRPINIPDAYQDSRFNQAFDKKSGFVTRSILSVPIISQQNRLLGVVQVLNKRGGVFTDDDQNFLRAICTHLALALQRAELVDSYVQTQKLQQYLKLAHEIQMGMVPRDFPAFPDKPEVDIHAVLDPALDVGGDLYDYFLLDENRLCFIIGDVSDKGIPAALFMAITRTAFKISAMGNSGLVATTLELVNKFLCAGNDSQMFVTVFCGILDLRTGRVEYSDGGHEPPFIIRHKTGVEFVDKKGGMALGFMDGIPFPTGYLQLNPGDTLVLYTDGVNEALDNDSQLFHVNRMDTTLRRYVDGVPASTIVRALVDDVAAFVGSAPQSDDLTIVTLRYLGPRTEPLTA
ncbi:MAG: GAF domain-containing SpoIIE family protein phosphatase [Bryobacteraceae bacterium]|nr:GAF domain-containing SpoIIE family protein phosphatase [Bryobacteraceae bacterium]